MKKINAFLSTSLIVFASIGVAQPAGTQPPADRFLPRLPALPPRGFELASPALSMDLARLDAELAGVGHRLAPLASLNLAQLGAEVALAGAHLPTLPPMGHLSTDLMRLDAELAMGSMHMMDAPFIQFDFPGDMEWDNDENPQQDPGYQTYKEGYNLILQEKLEDARKKLSDVLSKFPRSRYVDDAQYWIAYSWMQTQPKKAASLYREFFKKYPTSNYFDDAVADLGRLEGQAAADSARAVKAEYEARELSRQMRATAIAPPIPSATPSPSASPSPSTAPAVANTPRPPRAREDNPDLRIKKDALEALGRNPDEASLKTLQEITTDQSQHRELRQTAMHALQRVEGAKALDVFLTIAKSDPDENVRKDALYYIGQYAKKDDERAYEILKEYAADSRQPREVRESAMHALKETKKADILNLYLQIAKTDSDTKIKQSALYYIGQLAKGNDERAHKVLKEYALDRSQDKEVRETALYSLKEVKNADALSVYLDVAKNDPNNDMRQTAIYYIGQLARKDDEKAYQVLKEYALDTKQDEEIRENALHSLRELRRPDILNLLIGVAKNDPVEKIRHTAIYQLGQLRKYYGAEVSTLLKEFVLDQKQPREVRKAAMYAIREFKDLDVYNIFIELAKTDPDPDIQQSAIYYIAHDNKKDEGGKALDMLMVVFEKLSPDREEALEGCLYGIAQIGGDRAVDFLIKVAKTHKNYELRQKAVYYLGNIGGEKARSALMEILKGK